MNQICIAKKVSHQNVEFLDFAVGEDDKLIVFSSFKEASEFLKKEVGTGEELLDYIITTVEAQKDNPRMKEIISGGVSTPSATQTIPTQEVSSSNVSTVPFQRIHNDSSEVEVYFVLDCSKYEISNSDSIICKETNRQLVPVLAFVDALNPEQLVNNPNFKLKHAYIGQVQKD